MDLWQLIQTNPGIVAGGITWVLVGVYKLLRKGETADQLESLRRLGAATLLTVITTLAAQMAAGFDWRKVPMALLVAWITSQAANGTAKGVKAVVHAAS